MAEVLGPGVRATSRGNLIRVVRPLREPWYERRVGPLPLNVWAGAACLIPATAALSMGFSWPALVVVVLTYFMVGVAVLMKAEVPRGR